MEAANRGARRPAARRSAATSSCPRSKQPNRYLDAGSTFRYFFVRKVMLVKYSYAFVGDARRLRHADELFEALTLVQTGKIETSLSS